MRKEEEGKRRVETIPAIERVDPQNPDHAVLLSEHIVRYFFSSSFVSGKRVLDAGCGEGYGAAALQTVGATAVIGIDLDEAALRSAQAQYERDNLHFLVGTVTNLPFPDHSIDVVVCFEVLEHLAESDQRAFISEVDRVLDTNGTLIISTPNTEIYAPHVSTAILGVNPFHLHEHTYEEFAHILSNSFAHVEIIGQTPIPAEIVTTADASPNLVRYHAIDDLVYVVHIPNGSVSIAAQLAVRPLPQLSPYMLAVCHKGSATLSRPNRNIETITNSPADVVVFSLWARWGAHYQPVLDRLLVENHRLEQDLKERTAWALSLNREMEPMRSVIKELQQLVEERTEWARSLGRQLEPTRSVVEELQQLVEERTAWAESLGREMERARSVIADLQQLVEERTAWAQSLDREMEQVRLNNESARQ